MSAPSGGATSAPQCACTNISIMQLFHELKQQFPGVPDHVVSNTISSHCHDRSACQLRLECEAKNYISHLYPSSSLSAAKKEGRDILFPQQCPNQLVITKESERPKNIQITSICPQKGTCSVINKLDENDNDQNAWSDKNEKCYSPEPEVCATDNKALDISSPDDTNSNNNCETKGANSPQDLECKSKGTVSVKDENSNDCIACISDSKRYKILKSNKVTSGLNKKLDSPNKKNDSLPGALPKEDNKETQTNNNVKLKRPTTLEFATDPSFSDFSNIPKNGTAFPQESLNDKNKSEDVNDSSKSQQSNQHKCSDKSTSETKKVEDGANVNFSQRDEPYPLNVSLNLNCRMDVHPNVNRSQQNQYSDPWRGNYSSPGSITSVNLTVCTPTGVMHGVPGDKRNPSSGGTQFNMNSMDPRQRGFEGRVQITVSPASAQPPSYRVPPPTPAQNRQSFSPLSQMMPDAPLATPDSLVRRQKARLARLQSALAAERSRLASMQREVSILQGPLPRSATHLRPDVQRLRRLCQRLTHQLDRVTANADGEFYDNIYTGQRATRVPMGRPETEEQDGSWQCHVCTFRNNAFLNKCEQCDMPRIILGRAEHPLTLTPVVPPATNPRSIQFRPDTHHLNMDSIVIPMMDQQTISSDPKKHAG